MVNFDKKKTEQFKQQVELEYAREQVVDKIIRSSPVSQTDGSFTQIGLRPLVPHDMFLENSNIHPELVGLGTMVANGELAFLTEQILKTPNISHIKVSKREFSPESLQYELSNWKASIIVSADVYYDLMGTGSWAKYISYTGTKEFKFSGYYSLFVIHKAAYEWKKTIIIIDNQLGGAWYRWLAKNSKGNLIPIHIDIGSQVKDQKIDIAVKTVNKLYLTPEYIKVIEISE